ncbi:TIGR02680 family protein [Nocardia sp. NBC_00565]|uniref:TIGR02680 family protein n=1 Tax=Nocardia sp. NBC_00565 TaxID=2975993 RepID=UPI002E819745|nr:TIGR02680 family protein [Nocardia sp. NBC_00565]WUB99906.1 TIGR02680 family protein [Nocardia sp. NBC_00565]
MTVTALPRPMADADDERPVRWIPSRAGILNVWRYYDEVFEFHQGRLLLRGPNGSGKSKALELLLPFLFDANLRANRLSTFGTGERTMHWNLMGEGATGTTRVGYVWLEFRLPGDPERWFTCGARLQASSHTTTVHPDYFTTDLRIGDGLTLTTDGRPLTRTALEERLGTRGTVHGNAGDYRDEIRSALFPTLNEQRYDALITAMLQLRTPKLSQRLDPALLSTLLSRALPPLGQDEIADLAEGFERLDAQRERLTRLAEEVGATRTLARQQKTYAQRVLRAGAAALISATTELDRLSNAAKKSAEEYESVAQRKKETEEQIEGLEAERSQDEARKEGLLESEAYKQGQELDRLRRDTVKAQSRAADIRRDATSYRNGAQDDVSKYQVAVAAVQGQARIVDGLATETEQAAARVGMSSVYEEISAALDTDRPRSLLRGAVRGRRDQIGATVLALEAHERAVTLRGQAERDLDLAREGYTDAEAARIAAAEGRERALEDLRIGLREWVGRCRELGFLDPEALADMADSESAVAEAVNAAASTVLEEISKQETLCESAVTTARGEREELVAERVRLSDEQDILPVAPHWRTTDREHLSGAPLWRLVDFADDISESAQAGIEAALEASGLLDAWVGPRGEVVGHDVFADPAVLAPMSGRSLADVLVPLPDTVIATSVVRRLLSTIAFDDRLPTGAVVAVGADGAWRTGNLTGSWHKEQPAFVGALTRQRARERRIRELDQQIAEYDIMLARLADDLQALSARRQAVRAERGAKPGHDELTTAQLLLTRAESDLAAADGVVRQRVDDVSVREHAVKTALLELSSLAAENGLPTARGALDRVAEALDTFCGQAEGWLDAHGDLRSASSSAEFLAEQARRSTGLAEQRENEAAAAEDEHRQLTAKLDAIEGAVGLDYLGVLDQINDLRTRIGELVDGIRVAGLKVNDLAEELGRLGSQRITDAKAHEIAEAARDTVAQRFRHMAAGVFPADSEITDLTTFQNTLTGSEGVRAALEAARLVAAAWPTIPHAPANLGEALRRLADSVHDCRTALSSRADLDLETDEDIQVFTAVVDGVRVGAAELLHILRTEADQAEHEITEQERQLFDQTLTGDTRRHLAARIRQANELVDGMNARLERVRTASNVAVRLVWQIAPDLPPGTKAARDLLLKDPVRLTETDHQSLHRFLRDRIEEAKADDTATSWEQQLAQVFDYTAWHRFVVKVDRGNGEGWQLLTKKLHGALSGGEKAIALHLPLFAAVAAHYQAAPEAPRVILLDEVFVGVDTTNRGQIFALLSALDLDLVLTSDHEWCTYAELSGIGIHQILTGDGDDAVTTARFTWDGHDLHAD